VRRSLVAVYGLLALGDIAWSAMFPLGPAYRDGLALSSTEVGVLFAAFPVAVLLVSIPAGRAADRIGPLRVTTISGIALATGCAGQALADGFVPLFAMRSLQGLAFGAIWPAGLAYLQEVLPAAQRARVLTGAMIVAGAATMIGPTFGGLVSERLSVAAPFAICGAVTLVMTLPLIGLRDHPGSITTPTRLRSDIRLLSRDAAAIAGLVFMALPTFVANTIHLLIPLDLRDAGSSDAAIGVGLTVGAGLFLATSIVITRVGARAVGIGLGAAAAGLLGLLCLIPLATAEAPALYAFLTARGLPLATLFAMAVPLTALGAERVGVGRASVLGLANAIWGVVAIASPITAGLLDDHVDRRAPWLADVVLCALALTWSLRARRRGRMAAG
jgi:MFS transporter, DHA1 family, solute carrier family 18 (vesicular amine transporter), member 1/2